MEMDMTEEVAQPELTLAKIAADIVVAYISRNVMVADDLPRLTMQIREALVGPAGGAVVAQAASSPAVSGRADYEAHDHDHADQIRPMEAQPKARTQKPAVPISKSVSPDYIICLEDGKKFRSLKRHLRSEHGMSAEQYREKWDLPQHYELVAPNYSAVRTALAKQHGLGRGAKTTRQERVPKIAAE